MKKRNDELSKILEDSESDDRLQNWLWHYLTYLNINTHVNCFGDGSRNLMALAIKDRQAIVDGINSKKNSVLVNRSYFSWIKDNKRQIEWVRDRLKMAINIDAAVVTALQTGKLSLQDSSFTNSTLFSFFFF